MPPTALRASGAKILVESVGFEGSTNPVGCIYICSISINSAPICLAIFIPSPKNNIYYYYFLNIFLN